jgi:hypothetical protein
MFFQIASLYAHVSMKVRRRPTLYVCCVKAIQEISKCNKTSFS